MNSSRAGLPAWVCSIPRWMAGIISSGDSFRPDEAEFFPHRDEILGQVPKIKDGYVVVPKIID